jgi:anti-sigma regulatory factor (Ser/Thr protein kinase)
MSFRILSASQLSVTIADSSSIGECRRAAKALAESHGFEEASVGRICIIATEVATNIVRHAQTGRVLVQVLDDGARPEFEVLGIDRGPGMIDIDRCMRDGYSTGGTAGNGLGAISRLSSTFDVFSAPDKGTVVLSRTFGKGEPSKAASGVELGAICLAVQGEIECGDTWRAADSKASFSMLIADGLGHGPAAATASQAAAAAFVAQPFESPSIGMNNMHRALSGTRGAAASCALLHVAEQRIDYAGVGNICATVVTEDRSRGMVSHNGTLGVQLLRTQQFEYPWPPGSYVVMHSDGLSARWNLQDYSGLRGRHPAIVAAILYRDRARPRDDATILVARRTL